MTGLYGFIAPQFLAAALAACIVVLIHFLRRPKTVSLAFPSLRFFSASTVTASKSRSLNKLLLLIIRMLMIITVSVIFSALYLKNHPLRLLSLESTSLNVWIDPSPGMGFVEDGSTAHDKATRMFDSLCRYLPPGRKIALYREESGTFDAPSGPPNAAVESPRLITDRSRFFKAISRCYTAAKKPVFLLLSDFRTPAAELADSLCAIRLEPAATIMAISFSPKSPWNVSCRQITIITGTENIITPRIVSDAPHPVTCRVSLRLDNMRLPQITISLPAHGDTTLYITVPQHSIFQSGSIQLLCDDPLQFDNVRYFTVQTGALPSVLVVGDSLVNLPLFAAIASLDIHHGRKITCCQHVNLTIDKIHAADIIILCGGEQSVYSEKLISKTHPVHPQAIITTIDSSLATALQLHTPAWTSPDHPLSARLTDTISSFWTDFPVINCNEVNIRGYAPGLSGITHLYLSNGKALLTSQESGTNRLFINIATPLGISSVNNLCETGFFVPLIDRIFRQADLFVTPRHAAWPSGMLTRNPFFGHRAPASLLDESGKHIAQLQQQSYFRIPPPGIYTLTAEGTSSEYRAINFDTLASDLTYRLPVVNRASPNDLLIVPPDEVLGYLASHQTSLEWFIPWLFLTLLCIAELLIRMRLGRQPIVARR